VRRSSSRPEGPQSLGDLLPRVLGRKGLAARVEAASVVPEWPALVGPQIAAVTRPLRVSDGTLFVAVETSAWIMELNLMKSQIMRTLNAGKREGRIEALVFVMGESREEGRGKREENQPNS
jgi:predicted nucleic acid-binding Zn ribbon protein